MVVPVLIPAALVIVVVTVVRLFEPRGSHLVGSSQLEPEAGGTVELEVLEWAGCRAEGLSQLMLRPGASELDSLDVVDGEYRDRLDIWSPAPAAISGHLLQVASDGRGAPAQLFAGMRRQEDASLLMVVIGHLGDGSVSETHYLLGGHTSAGGRELVLARSAVDELAAELGLSDGLLRVDGDAAAADRFWLSACGGDVRLGDGVGWAWWLPWMAAGWGELGALDGTVRYAVPLPAGGGRR